MRHFLMGLAILALLAPPIHAQGGAEGYDKMSVKAGLMRGNINTNRPESFSNGARIVLKSSDGSKPDLPISANTITFSWKDGQSSPVSIKMDGNVDIKHPDANITAQHANWNLETGDLVFTGNPVMDSTELKGLRAEKISINLNTGAYEMIQGEIDETPIGGMDSGGSDTPIPGELTEADITDWAGFINAIKAQGQASGENPGKQLLTRLDEKTRNLLQTIDTPTLVSNKGDILKKLNGVIRKPGLFKRNAWKGITLSDEAEVLIKIKDQTPEEQVRQNRLVLHAAYPNMLKAP
ncbi:MAG: hypothetical protein L3K26_08900 [Candidatus Hydrogenedentes bacterium]|nr:hypothetical protein [Candidatus Hydrogenedentota bacterium]